MNYYERHLGDYAKDTAHLTIMEHGAYGLLLDRYYSTEAGIPSDQAHRLSRARTREERQAVDAVLNEFFTLVDGVWINDRCEEEIEKAQSKIKAAQENGKRGGRPKGSKTETQEKPNGLFLGSKTETQEKAHHTPDTRHQTPIKTSSTTHASTETHVEREQPDESACVTPETDSPTQAGAACKAMRQAGLSDGNPSHPTLLALIEAGATTQEFAIAAGEAANRGKGFAYALGTVKRRREEAAKLVLHQGKLPNKQQALEANNRAVGVEWERKMREQMEVANAG